MSLTNFPGPVVVNGMYVGTDIFLKPRPGGRTFFIAAGSTTQQGFPSGSDYYDGTDWDQPWATIDRWLEDQRTFDRVFFVGDIREEGKIFSNLSFDNQLIGCGGDHHPDIPSSAYNPGAAMWRPPASPTAATPLAYLRGRGFEMFNVHVDAPVDKAAFVGQANALSGTSEYDASHCGFYNCSGQQGYGFFEDAGGLINVKVYGGIYRIFSPTGACVFRSTSTAVRVPQYWRFIGVNFPPNAASGGNESHIDAPLNGSLIKGCELGTVEGSALYVDLTGGAGNVVTKNLLMGSYDTSDYVAGTGDNWSGNITADISGNSSVGDNGLTIAVPAAP